MIVVVIIGILAAIAIPKFSDVSESARGTPAVPIYVPFQPGRIYHAQMVLCGNSNRS